MRHGRTGASLKVRSGTSTPARTGRRITDTFVNSLTVSPARWQVRLHRQRFFALAVLASYWVGKAVSLRPNEQTVLHAAMPGSTADVARASTNVYRLRSENP